MQAKVKPPGDRGTQPITPEYIQQVVDHIARSRTFERSEQLRKILLVLSNTVAEGRASEITEAMIGERILNRKDFDPETDTIVRVQMRRLRSKLEEYYRTEGASDPLRLEIPRYSYVPQFREAAASSEPAPQPELANPGGRGFWWGFAAASAIFGIIGAAVLLMPREAARGVALDRAVARSPFWKAFVHPKSQPIIAVSTPLFFRTHGSYVRDFRLNFQEDVVYAKTLIGGQPAWPSWTTFASLTDAETVLLVERLLSPYGARAVVKSAREVTSEELQKGPIIFLGHPRGSPPLLDLLSKLPFYVRRTAAAQSVRGIVNRAPRAGELPEYINDGETDIEVLSENRPDYVLLTSLPRPSGSSVLSVFGNRYASTYPVVRALADASFMSNLRTRVARDSGFGWESVGVQVVFKVAYLNGKPMDVEYLTHRLLAPDVHPAAIR